MSATTTFKPKLTSYKLPKGALQKRLQQPLAKPMMSVQTAGRLPWIAGGLKIRRKIF